MSLYVGLMSGTSMDGIDAVLVDIPSNQLVHGITKSYSASVATALYDLMCKQELSLSALCQLNTLIGREFAAATLDLLKEAQVATKDVIAIGSHGQTVCHDADALVPYTLQLGCAHTISSLTGVTVVADFRTRDLVLGGQGAPFAPLYHQELFAQKQKNIALANVGGIANVTFISTDKPTCGWDVGPGNCLLDAWILQQQGTSFDKDGAWSAQGQVISLLLEQFLSDAFFQKEAPKSIGKEYFSLTWLEKHLNLHYDSTAFFRLAKVYEDVDIQATLLMLTAHSIANAVLQQSPIEYLYLCGGGVHNKQLLHTVAHLLPAIKVRSISEAGFSPDYLEAMMFAWLAAQAIHLNPVDLRFITGAKEPVVLGALYPHPMAS